VKDFVTEQIGNTVSGVTGAPVSMSYTPQQRNSGASLRRTTARARPGMRHSAITSATSSSNRANPFDGVSGMAPYLRVRQRLPFIVSDIRYRHSSAEDGSQVAVE